MMNICTYITYIYILYTWGGVLLVVRDIVVHEHNDVVVRDPVAAHCHLANLFLLYEHTREILDGQKLFEVLPSESKILDEG